MQSGKIHDGHAGDGADKPSASWTAAGSEAPRRLCPRGASTNHQMSTVRPKAVSRLRLATAVQDTPDFTDIHWELL
jgi:hypothetical protein